MHKTTTENKKTNLFLILSGVFLTNAILAELIGVKLFSLESTFGLDPANIPLLGYNLDFSLTAGVVIWPVVFITTDVINEYFGKEGVKKISFITVGLIAYGFLVVWVVIELPPAQFWLDVNQPESRPDFNIDYAFSKVYRQGLGIIIGSLVAFLIAQLLDVYVFQQLRRITGGKKIWLRATGSTLISQLIDSFVVLVIAFHIFGDWPIVQVLAVGVKNYIYKFVVAILITPVIYLAHYLIDNYLGKEQAGIMTAKASENRSFL
ncbi:MAG: queuosine precursor transporter [Cyclobacteriaceae bacterium]